MDLDLATTHRLGVAIALGLLVGIERGWRGRDEPAGGRTAGLRTFGLIGLLGGVTGLLAEAFGAAVPAALLIGLAFIGLAGLAATVYARMHQPDGDQSMTTEVALLATFLLAVLAGVGRLELAVAGTVVMVLLLSYKELLHGWLTKLQYPELTAGFQLLLMSLVLLPLLPNRGFGPWDALNPYVIWWMVVLIAVLSFIGYFAVRIAGARAGTLFTALFGGLASSTAVTLTFARLARRRSGHERLLAGGILLACGTMFPRMLIVASLIHRALFEHLVGPTLLMAAITYASAVWLLRDRKTSVRSEELLPRNPLELSSAFAFGALLALILLLGKALTEWFGDAGVYLLAAASGVADVDAITLSLSRLSRDSLALDVAVLGIVIAASVNSLVKAGMAMTVGGVALGRRVAIPLASAAAAGLLLALLLA
ncbi:MgtC/SapB family protein [Wenzhouxiangella sp. XN79A]|uniref:MgtC/SapB family protein n=1 Tax=Wenzhouxiangella sp. XN79A TaxID=2724193 RepID=UPI00144A9296|nr:MgtC/SapB family protein [Wenzhouxiangella sp. XN79A]NKI36115.1 MgtC/SapB family protein [Wenzhouxiangella sp. XN79A]